MVESEQLLVKIGETLGELRGVNRRLDEAADARAGLKAKIDGIGSTIQKVDAKASDLDRRALQIEKTIEEMKPEIDLVRNLKMKAAGAALVLGAIGAIMWSLFSVGIQALRAKFFNEGSL